MASLFGDESDETKAETGHSEHVKEEDELFVSDKDPFAAAAAGTKADASEASALAGSLFADAAGTSAADLFGDGESGEATGGGLFGETEGIFVNFISFVYFFRNSNISLFVLNKHEFISFNRGDCKI
jgi:hypothetical protein